MRDSDEARARTYIKMVHYVLKLITSLSMRVLLMVTVSMAVTWPLTSCLTISVGQNGTDVPGCIRGTTRCLSLGYVLTALTRYCSNSSDVIVEYFNNSIIGPANYTFFCDLKLRIKGSKINGSAVPNVICTSNGSLTLASSSNSSVSIQWESINIVNCSGPHAIGLVRYDFSACQFLSSRGIYIKNTNDVAMSETQFHFSGSYSKDACFVITNEATMTKLSIKDSVFVSRTTVTTLWIVRSVLQIKGNITFVDGFGRLGGAVRMTHSRVIANGNATVLFAENFAQYGSAVYVEDMVCPLLNTSIGYPNFVFRNNTRKYGQTVVYIDGNPGDCVIDNVSYNLSSDSGDLVLTTAATNASIRLPVDIGVYPGRNILLNVTIVDYFKDAAICSANTSMTVMNNDVEQSNIPCNDPRYEVQLFCPIVSLSQSSVVLYTSDNVNSTLQIRTDADPAISQHDWNISITFTCNNGPAAEASISFTVQKCPPFLTFYNTLTHSCECITPISENAHLICSVGYGAFCIENEYWVGSENDVFMVLPCKLPYCFPQQQSCPIKGKPSFRLLSEYPDDQCPTNHGGLLCGGCRDGYYFTHYPLQCVSSCPADSSVGILMASIIIHLLKSLAVIWLVSVLTKLGNLSQLSYLYSSFLYLHVIDCFPFAYMPQYKVLRILISIMRSICLPVVDIFGEIPVCFFPSLGPLEKYAFYYLGPAVEIVMLCIAGGVSLLCPSHRKHLLPQSIGILLLWPVWTIASTSITILTYSNFELLGSLRVMLQADLVYLSGPHLPLFIIAVLLLTLLVFPCCVMLVVSLLPFKRNVLKTFLFPGLQAIYKDKREWFSVVYLFYWLVTVATTQASSEYLLFYLTLLLTLCCMHYVFWPYRDEWLNRMDMAILLDLLITASLIRQHTHYSAPGITFVTSCGYIFVLAQHVCNTVLIAILLIAIFRHVASRSRAYAVPPALDKYDTLMRYCTPVEAVVINTPHRDGFDVSYVQVTCKK